MACLCLWRCWDKPENRIFAVFLASMNLWGVATFGMYVITDLGQAIWWERTALIFMASTAVFFYHFALRYSNDQTRFRSLTIAYIYLAAVIVLSPWNLIVDDMKVESYGNTPMPGSLFWAYIAPIYILTIAAVYRLNEARKAATSYAERNRFLYFIIGGSVFLAGGFTELSYILGIDSYPAGALSGIVFVFLAGLAVLKERLLDIQLWTYRVTPYALMFVILAIPFAAAYFILDHFRGDSRAPLWLWLATIAVVVILTPSLWQWARSWSNRLFYRGRLEHFKALERLREEAQSITDPSTIETYLPQLIQRAMLASHVHLLLPSHSRDNLETVASGTASGPNGHFTLSKQSQLAKWFTNHRELLRRDTIQIDPSLEAMLHPEKETINEMDGELHVPLISGERLVGLLIVGSKTDHRPYSWEDEKLLMRIAGQMALTLENIQLYQASLEREARLTALGRLTKTMSSSLDIQSIYNVFAEELKKIVPLDLASIVLIEGSELRFFALSTAMDSLWGKPGTTIPLEGTGTQWVAQNKKALVEPDLKCERRFCTGDNHLQHGIRSIVYLPLLSQGEVFGSFIVGSSQPNAYTETDVVFLEQVASQLSLTMENARLYARERGERHRLETINKQREDFLSIISHELKTPLTSIKSSSELLSEELAGDKQPSRKRLIENIRRSADRLETMLNSLLNMVRLRSGPLEVRLRSTDIIPCIRSAVDLCLLPIEEKHQSLEVDLPETLPAIMADAEGFELILTNLLGNANKFTPRGGSIKLKARVADSRMCIEVSDSGPGIPEAEQEFIFEPFYRGELSRSGVKGMGVGLATVKQLVHLHGGTVKVKSTGGEGSTFIVTLPLL